MTPNSITDREAELEQLYQDYCIKLEVIVTKLAEKRDSFDYRKVFNDAQNTGTTYFNRFDTSLDDYLSLDINPDQAVRKPEDAINIVPLIVRHWRVVRKYCKQFNLPVPEASPTAYATIQRVIKKFYPVKVLEIRKQFTDMALPTEGFDSKSEHTGWKKRAPYEVIAGIIIFIASGILVFTFNDPTGVQYIYLKLAMAIGGSITLMGLGHGFINIKWSMTKNLLIVAGGTVALFILLYFLNPPSPPDMKDNNPNKKKVENVK